MARKIILVAAEDAATAQCVRLVSDPAHEVVHAPTAERAAAELEKKSPSLVLLAHGLLRTQSLAFLAAIKEEWPALPVIYLVENFASELIREAFRAGANDVLPKPVVEAEVRASFNRILSTLAPARPRGLQQAYTRLKNFFSSSPFAPEKKETPSQQPADSSPALPGSAQEFEPPHLRAHYLGKFRVTVNEREVTHWSCRKSKLLFADLLMNHKRRPSREVLMEAFWPNVEPDAARNSLNVALHHIRRALHEALPAYDFILFKDDGYFLNPELDIWVDAEAFKQQWNKAQSREREHGREAALLEFERTAAMYAGDFMEDELYDSWAASQREHFKEIYLVALDRISKIYSLNGKPGRAVELCEKILTNDNCREDVHRRLMLCYYRLDKRDKALKQFKKCEEILQTELEVKPTRATIELYEKIKNGEGPKKRRVFGKI